MKFLSATYFVPILVVVVATAVAVIAQQQFDPSEYTMILLRLVPWFRRRQLLVVLELIWCVF
jgi:hypothetical protein